MLISVNGNIYQPFFFGGKVSKIGHVAMWQWFEQFRKFYDQSWECKDQFGVSPILKQNTMFPTNRKWDLGVAMSLAATKWWFHMVTMYHDMENRPQTGELCWSRNCRNHPEIWWHMLISIPTNRTMIPDNFPILDGLEYNTVTYMKINVHVHPCMKLWLPMAQWLLF